MIVFYKVQIYEMNFKGKREKGEGRRQKVRIEI
jgi:hypothetical protein